MDIKFIAKHPAAILVLGGFVTMWILKGWWVVPLSILLILIGVILHVAWLVSGRR